MIFVQQIFEEYNERLEQVKVNARKKATEHAVQIAEKIKELFFLDAELFKIRVSSCAIIVEAIKDADYLDKFKLPLNETSQYMIKEELETYRENYIEQFCEEFEELRLARQYRDDIGYFIIEFSRDYITNFDGLFVKNDIAEQNQQ